MGELFLFGRQLLTKGRFSSLPTYVVDTICVSELPPYSNKILLYTKYVKEDLSAKKIALQLGCSLTAVKDHLHKFGIAKNKTATHKENLSYGRKLSGNGLEAHKGETQVIDSIKRMYGKEGLTPSAITRILNTMKVPTKRQGKQWDHSLVIAILKREEIYQCSRKSPRKGGDDGKTN